MKKAIKSIAKGALMGGVAGKAIKGAKKLYKPKKMGEAVRSAMKSGAVKKLPKNIW